MVMEAQADDVERMLEAFAYIAEKNTRKNNEYNVLKVFYLADKLHMERYGRFIFNERYAALEKGPVPSNAYDLLKIIRMNDALPYGLESPVSICAHHKVVATRPFDDDLFSDSDLECIDEIIELSKHSDLGVVSHDQAWEKSIENNEHFIPEEYIIDILANADLIKDLINNRYQ